MKDYYFRYTKTLKTSTIKKQTIGFKTGSQTLTDTPPKKNTNGKLTYEKMLHIIVMREMQIQTMHAITY